MGYSSAQSHENDNKQACDDQIEWSYEDPATAVAVRVCLAFSCGGFFLLSFYNVTILVKVLLSCALFVVIEHHERDIIFVCGTSSHFL